jgi:hypothetical protein
VLGVVPPVFLVDFARTTLFFGGVLYSIHDGQRNNGFGMSALVVAGKHVVRS